MIVEDIKPPKWWVKQKELQIKRQRMRKVISSFEVMGGTIGNKAVLIVYDANRPDKTYILTEKV